MTTHGLGRGNGETRGWRGGPGGGGFAGGRRRSRLDILGEALEVGEIMQGLGVNGGQELPETVGT